MGLNLINGNTGRNHESTVLPLRRRLYFGSVSLCDEDVPPFKDRTFCDEITSSVSSEFVAIFGLFFGFGIQQW